MRISNLNKLFLLGVTFLFLSGCVSTISPFSPKAYEQATSLKVEALATMDKAFEPYANHKQAVDILKINLEKAYEYSSGRPLNIESTKQWSIIKDPSRNSLGGFLKRWEENTTLNKVFIEQSKSIVSDGFDEVIGLESGKLKPAGGNTQ